MKPYYHTALIVKNLSSSVLVIEGKNWNVRDISLSEDRLEIIKNTSLFKRIFFQLQCMYIYIIIVEVLKKIM